MMVMVSPKVSQAGAPKIYKGGGGLVVIFTHSRDGKLISRQVVPDDDQYVDEFDQAAKLLFEMACPKEDDQSA